MQIETKYNIGDEVWFLLFFDEIPVCGKIEDISISVNRYSDVKGFYGIRSNGCFYHLSKESLFPTKEELLKSL